MLLQWVGQTNLSQTLTQRVSETNVPVPAKILGQKYHFAAVSNNI